jgi:3-hydroxyisobutyrate dehydrogenase
MHVGGLGAGYTAKLLVNLIWFGQALATAEALLIGQAAGIDPGVLRAVLAGSAAESTFVRRDLGHLLRGDYLPSFSLDRICGELDAVMALGDEFQVPHELSAQVSGMYQRALSRFGATKGELLAVALLEEEAGQRVRSESRPAHDR